MIGNAADAALTLTDPEEFLLSDDGGTRKVYLINGIVYKVERSGINYSCNVTENMNINGGMTLPEGFKFPKASLYTIDGVPVLAMEYIAGIAKAACYCFEDEEHDASCMRRKDEEILRNLIDVGGFNVIYNDEGAFVIDAA